MMRKLLVAVLLWVCVSGVAEARERLFGYCMKGGYKVTTQGLQSTEYFQRTFRSCTVRVYDAGTTTLVASIYSDNLTPNSTPLANPFTSASDGYWEFYASAGRYDVQFTDTATSTQYTWGDLLACDPLGPNADTDCSPGGGATTPHNLLSETHPDTVPYSPPEIGDLPRGNLYQTWERLGVSQIGQVLTLIDVGGGLPIEEWVWPSTLDTCGSVQVSGVEAGCEHEINFIPGTNITSITAVDDSANDRIDVTINAASGGGGSLTCSPDTIVDIYVDDAGSDVTGDGSIGNPYATIQHAIDTDVPVFVGYKYYIHISSTGTYAGFTYTSRTDCAGGVECGNSAPDYLTPFGTGLSIIGSTDGVASDSWIINTPIIVDGLKLYVQGVQIDTAGIGLTAQNHATVALGAVHFYNNNLGLLVATWSQAYLIPGVYVEDDTYTALATADNFDPSSDGFEATEDSVITDSCPDGDNAPLGTTVGCESNGTGNFGIACIECKKAQVYFRDDVLIDFTTGVGADGIQGLDSHFAMARYTLTSTGISTAGRGMDVQAGRVSGGAFGGGVYSITAAKYGVALSNGAEITDIPTIAGSVTADYLTVLNSEKGATNFIGAAGGTTYVNTFSATPTFDITLGYVHKITLTGDVTASTISNPFHGAILTMQICQDGGGAHTFAWPADVLGADAIGATASKCNIQRFVYDSAAVSWYALAAMVKNQ